MLAFAVALTWAIAAVAAEPQLAGPASGDGRSAAAPQAVTTGGVVQGRITSVATGKPLRRAQVRLAPADDVLATPRTARTSTDGRYEFRDVAPGRYSLRAERTGYLPLTYGQRRSGDLGRPLDIAEKEVADKIDFALSGMGVISGRVLDDLGEPIAGVVVWALQTRYVQGRRQLAATGATASTDTTGRYRLLSLPPGDYAVMATTRATWPLDSDPTQVFGYATTYFPGTSAAAQARRVTVGAAQHVASIDFSLVPGRISTVRGFAMSALGLPLGGETITMMREIPGPTTGMGSAVVMGSTTAAADGSWKLTDIAPGEYRLSIRAAARGNEPAQEGQLAVSVTGSDVEGLSLVAGAGGTISGEVVTDDGTPLPTGFERLLVRPPFNANTRALLSVLQPDNGRVQSDGSFEVRGVLADTVLSIGPLTDEWTLKAIEVEGRDLADRPLPVEQGRTLSAVRVVLSSHPTVLRGALRDGQQHPTDGTVLVFGEDPVTWREGSRTIRATRLDQRGLFTFRGLPAGDYFLIALESVSDGQWYDPEFLEGLKDRSRRVVIIDGTPTQADLVVSK